MHEARAFRPSEPPLPPSTQEVECFGQTLTITEAKPLPLKVEGLDLSRFGEKEREIRVVLTIIEEWILYPMIEDSFQDHSERRRWERSLPKESGIGVVLENNKLSLGQVAALSNALFLLLRYLNGTPLCQRIETYSQTVQGIISGLNRCAKLGGSGKEAYRSLIKDLDTVMRTLLEEFVSKT